jgi:hypothetical protein
MKISIKGDSFQKGRTGEQKTIRTINSIGLKKAGNCAGVEQSRGNPSDPGSAKTGHSWHRKSHSTGQATAMGLAVRKSGQPPVSYFQ